jgi:hypothetical protein
MGDLDVGRIIILDLKYCENVNEACGLMEGDSDGSYEYLHSTTGQY